jgi:sugar phosphate isomerase/epimerase
MLCVVTGEISVDPLCAVETALEWGVKNFEIKRVFDNRLPYVSEDGYQVLESISKRSDVNIVALSPGLFDKPIGNWLFDWDAGWKLDDSLRLCNKVGAKVMVVFGIKNSGKESFQQVVDHFGSVAEKAKAAGVVVAIEPHKGNWVETAASGAKLLEAVNSDFLGFNYDVANCRHSEEPAEGYKHARPWIKHVHLKGSQKKQGGGAKHCVVGDGDLGWPELFKNFKADGIDVGFSVETHIKPRLPNTRACIEATRKMMTEVGLEL